MAIVSKVFFMLSSNSTDSRCAPGINIDAVSSARKVISLEPPPAGISPTPVSTNPM